MRTVAKNSEELCADFAQGGTLVRTPTGNMSVRDGVLYSYAMPIATISESGVMFVRDHGPSLTTNRHISDVGYAGRNCAAQEYGHVRACLRINVGDYEAFGLWFDELKSSTMRSGGVPGPRLHPWRNQMSHAGDYIHMALNETQRFRCASRMWDPTGNISTPADLERLGEVYLVNTTQTTITNEAVVTLDSPFYGVRNYFILPALPENLLETLYSILDPSVVAASQAADVGRIFGYGLIADPDIATRRLSTKLGAKLEFEFPSYAARDVIGTPFALLSCGSALTATDVRRRGPDIYVRGMIRLYKKDHNTGRGLVCVHGDNLAKESFRRIRTQSYAGDTLPPYNTAARKNMWWRLVPPSKPVLFTSQRDKEAMQAWFSS